MASNNVWRVITSITAFSGLAFITASLTYFVQVLSAVGLQSKLSLYINSMGRSPQQILANSWDEKGFSSFFDNVSDICQMLMQLSSSLTMSCLLLLLQPSSAIKACSTFPGSLKKLLAPPSINTSGRVAQTVILSITCIDTKVSPQIYNAAP